MYRQEKSHLTYQVEGRLSAYLSDIDDCEEFSSTSLIKLERTMKMTECIHSLLGHIKSNCITDNRNLLHTNKLTLDNNAEVKTQYCINWTPAKNAKMISGYLRLTFFIPDLTLLNLSNFHSDSIEGLTNLIIDLTTLTYSKETNTKELNLVIIKTKGLDTVTRENETAIKNELEVFCGYKEINPTFIYIRHKDSVGHFHKHSSNYEQN